MKPPPSAPRSARILPPLLAFALAFAAFLANAPLAAAAPPLPDETRQLFRRFGPAEGFAAGEILAIEQTTDRFLWLGTTSGLWRFDGRRFEAIDPARTNKSVTEPVESLALDLDGYLFVGLRRSGLMRFTGRTFLAVSRPASGDWNVSVLEERSDGVLWVAGSDQLWHLDRGGNSVKPALPGLGIRHLMTDPYGYTWVAAKSGLFRRIGAAFQPVTLPFGRSAANARALALDGQGSLWMAPAGGGLWRLSGNFDRGGLPQEIEELRLFDGIEVEHAKTDRSGRLWLATTAGLYHQDRDGFTRVPSIAPPCRRIFEDVDGHLWIACGGGVLYQLYENRPKPRLKPVLARITTTNAEYLPTGRLTLEPDHGSLRLELAAPYFEPGESPRFRFRFEGLDDDWRESTDGIADYAAIPSGDHLFRAQAGFGPSFEGEELLLEISKPRPPWRNPWIWLAAVAALAVIALLILFALRPARPEFHNDDDDDQPVFLEGPGRPEPLTGGGNAGPAGAAPTPPKGAKNMPGPREKATPPRSPKPPGDP